MGARDLGFSVGWSSSLGKQAKNAVVGLAGLPRAVIKGLIKLVEDPQGTVEATLAKIKELPAYVKHAPAAFKEHIHAIQAIEDPYEQGKAVGEFMGKVLLAGGAVGKISSKLGRWIQPTKNAYEIAKLPGAKHHRVYIDYRIKTSRELNKGMRSFQRRIDEHRDKISNPQKCYRIGILLLQIVSRGKSQVGKQRSRDFQSKWR